MAPENATNESISDTGTRTNGVVKHGLIALVTTNAVNLFVLAGGLALVEYPPEFTGGPFGPLALAPVVVNTTVAVVGASAVFAVVNRYATRPARTFTVVAFAAFVASFGMFLAPDLSGAPSSVFGLLAVMHFTTTVVVVSVFLRAARNGRGSR